MRFFFSSGVRNDLLQEIADNTDTLETKIQSVIAQSIYPFGITNQKPIASNYDATLSPHASTSRFNYTVPSNKQAIVYGIATTIMRVTAASSVGSSRLWINITPSGGGGIIVNSVTTVITNIDSDVHSTLPYNYLLSTGDKIEIRTSDSSTSGTVNFITNISINEFDV